MPKSKCKLCGREELKVRMIKALQGYTCLPCMASLRDKALKNIKPGGVLYKQLIPVIKSECS